MVAFKSFLILLTLGAEALAAAVPASTCSTALGTNTVKNVPTSRVTSIKKITITKKVIRKVNIIVVPVAKTSTIRKIETSTSISTANKNTKTATSTIISESTVVSSRTSWSTTTTVTSTVTTKFITSTVAKPAGFTDINNQPLTYKRAVKKRVTTITTGVPGGSMPQSVRCVKEIPSYSTKTITTTVQGPRTTLKAATKFKTITSFTTVTSTEYPSDASTTVTTIERPTTTSFVDVTSTTTITSSVTVESQIPQSTEFDICSEENIMSTANGGVVSGFDQWQGNGYALSVGGGLNARSCCQICASHADCLGSYFRITGGSCNIYIAGDAAICANSAQPIIALFRTNRDLSMSVLLSNGPCGQWKNDGDATPTSA
ncbi:hypothetical protein FPOAC2_09702 [Fusarium poae]|uniref:hypothetical protein n=1 Tax=Fusarium poae TaxID=36050 RepID=UPI001CEA2098|nr:hypothetical protein FPOAC1_009758 [Fusarium poae]KAG8670350.1 hypothetical protein FPOAC1_009758 [Fusarium poae]